MNIRKVLYVFMAVMLALTALIAILGYEMKASLGDFAATATQKEVSLELGREMRQSSDELTRYARLYVQTKDKKYLDVYNAIVDIRAGKLDRPEGYNANYWANTPNNIKDRLTPGKKIPLVDLMKENGILDEELAQLTSANQKSTKLADRETAAFQAIEGKGISTQIPSLPGESPDVYANRILSDESYMTSKNEIGKDIDEFEKKVNARTQTAYDDAEGTVNTLLVSFGAAVIALIVAIVVFLKYILSSVVVPIGILTAAFEKVNGRFSVQEIHISAENDLKWLGNNLNEFLAQIRGFIQNVGDAATDIAASSEELTATAENTATDAVRIDADITGASNHMTEQNTSMSKVDSSIE